MKQKKKKKEGFLRILLDTLGASLLGNLLAGKGTIRVGKGTVLKRHCVKRHYRYYQVNTYKMNEIINKVFISMK